MESRTGVEDAVNSWLQELGLPKCDLALNWLQEEPFLWLTQRFNVSNRLSKPFRNVNDDGFLDENKINYELHQIIKYDKSCIDFNVDEQFLSEEELDIKDLKNKIDQILEEKELLQRNMDLGDELDLEFKREFDHYSSLKEQKSFSLSNISKKYEESDEELSNQKKEFYGFICDELDNYIAAGMLYENQINEAQFEEYFMSNQFFVSHLKNRLSQNSGAQQNTLNEALNNFNEIYTTNNSECDSSDLISLIQVNKRVEDAIWNYIKVKAELHQSKESFKFYLRSRNGDFIPSSAVHIYQRGDLVRMKSVDYEKEVHQYIKSFMKKHISYTLHHDLKLQTLRVQFIFDELNMLLSSIHSLNTCGNMLLSSITKQDKMKDDIINLFYSMMKLLMVDIYEVDRQNEVVDQHLSKANVNDFNQTNDILFFKKMLRTIFKLTDDIDLEEVMKVIHSVFDKANKMNKHILQDQFTSFIMQLDRNKKKTKTVKEFIWDGPAYQPNICNRKTELDIYQLEKQNLLDNEKRKHLCAKFVDLKASLNLQADA